MFKLAFACFASALFLFFTHSSGSHNTTSSSTICPTRRCENGPNISYPFRLVEGHTPDQYCGYDGLGLICYDNGDTIFAPSGKYYYVKHIDYENHSLKLVDFDTANETCPRALHNFPLGNLPLSHSPLNLDLSFYYNCSRYPPDVPPIKCLRSGVNESFVFEVGNETKGFDWSQNCQENVVVTVMKDQITSEGLMNEFAGAMNEGFVLDWQTAGNCAECEASEGLCGYNHTRKELLCFCNDGSTRSNSCKVGSSTSLSGLIIGFIAGGIGALLLLCIILYRFRSKLKTKKVDQDIEAFIRNNGPPAIKRYSYSEIKKGTNSFKSKLGQGGYGQVYKGHLNNNCAVAVKLLNASKGNGEEFINEVVSISRTSHVNIVNLLGFCLEGPKKALVYEFMPNGSLEKFIHNRNFETNPPLSWERLYQIAEGVAKGLEYLHKGCNTRILHFDIKPSNKNFLIAKIFVFSFLFFFPIMFCILVNFPAQLGLCGLFI